MIDNFWYRVPGRSHCVVREELGVTLLYIPADRNMMMRSFDDIYPMKNETADSPILPHRRASAKLTVLSSPGGHR